MKYRIFFILLLVLFCQMPKNSSYYSPSGKIYDSKFQDKTILILPFEDKRENEKKQAVGLPLIPFYFFETIHFTKKGSSLRLVDSDKLQYALKNQMRYSKLFGESFQAYNKKNETYDYYIHAKIHSLNFKRTFTLYGLSIFGIYLYFLGLPALYDDFDMNLEFCLYDKNENLILIKNYHSITFHVENLYSKSFDRKLESILSKNFNRFIEEIEKLDL